jgi:EAL domain-containing protein (putative c-di-GMP-specific phosphodiesterase class I)
MGFQIALDDFGTGHCGINYLKNLPVDSIKIDRSYVRDMANDEVARVFVSALAQIARIQNITIVAEASKQQKSLHFPAQPDATGSKVIS